MNDKDNSSSWVIGNLPLVSLILVKMNKLGKFSSFINFPSPLLKTCRPSRFWSECEMGFVWRMQFIGIGFIHSFSEGKAWQVGSLSHFGSNSSLYLMFCLVMALTSINLSYWEKNQKQSHLLVLMVCFSHLFLELINEIWIAFNRLFLASFVHTERKTWQGFLKFFTVRKYSI